jgi:alpha-maltose-1-phosphate synthase
MKISIVRGAFANPAELQNFYPLKSKYDLQLITSLHPINDQIDLPTIRTFSSTDLPNFPFKYPILNRLLIDIHHLKNLPKLIQGSEVVHVAETYYGYTHQAIEAKKKGLVKHIVSTAWEIIPHNNESIRGRVNFKHEVYQHVDMFICPTDMAKRALLSEGVAPSKIVTIPIGVDTTRFSTHQTSKEVTNILFIGRLVPEKGVKDLVEAYKSLKNRYPKLTLTLIGKGPLSIQSPGITVKQVDYSKIHEEYQKADIFCLPSKSAPYWQEQYGMVLVEALSSGLPIVTSKSGAIEEVCENSALFIDEGNVVQLTKHLENLINGPSLRHTLSESSRKLALRRYTIEKTSARIAAIYEQLCHSNRQ